MKRLSVLLAAAALATACIPADHALNLGSVEFTVGATRITKSGTRTGDFIDSWSLTFDRVVLGFKTMTIGQVGQTDRCSYRGRGALANVLFDVRSPNVQTFNGIAPSTCPDVGVVLGPPDDGTSLGGGVVSDDLVELAQGNAHALVEATATRPDRGTYHVRLLFPNDRTSSHFGGCHANGERGVTIDALDRDDAEVDFGAEALFRDSISTNAQLRFDPWPDADRDGDHMITMAEIDAFPLSRAQVYNDFYELEDGSTHGSFGDYVRLLFKLVFTFRRTGACQGNAPGGD